MAGLDRGADGLEGRDHALPVVRHRDRIRRHEGQPRATRERLSQAHAGMDPERLGGLRNLADELLAPRLGGQRGRASQQRRAPAGGNGPLESRKHRADD